MKNRSTFRTLLQPLAIAIAAALLIRLLVQAYSIPSESMAPTLLTGDHILVTPYDLFWMHGEPRRGDVIVFRQPSTQETMIKRVIGLPLEQIEVRDEAVRVGGRTVAEPWLPRRGGNGVVLEQSVPFDCYFVMGDNRANSVDSRSWGCVSREEILGRARIVFWSQGSGGSRDSAWAAAATPSSGSDHGIRWRRMLLPIR